MRDCFAVTCTDSFLLSVFAFLCVCPLVCVCGCVCLNLHKEARGYPQVLSFRCPAWNSLCGLGSLSTEPLVSTCLCVPSTGLEAWGLPALFILHGFWEWTQCTELLLQHPARAGSLALLPPSPLSQQRSVSEASACWSAGRRRASSFLRS